jgi:hypothetical protein
MASETIKEKPTLYKPNTLVRWQDMPARGRSGRRFVGDNPPRQAQIFYSLPKKATKVTLQIQDIEGKTVAELNVPSGEGLNKVLWNTAMRPAGGAGGAATVGGGRGGGGQGGAGGGGGGGGRFGGGLGGRQVPAGSYRVVLNVDGESFTQSLTIEGDPVPPRSLTADEDEDDGEDMDKD